MLGISIMLEHHRCNRSGNLKDLIWRPVQTSTLGSRQSSLFFSGTSHKGDVHILNYQCLCWDPLCTIRRGWHSKWPCLLPKTHAQDDGFWNLTTECRPNPDHLDDDAVGDNDDADDNADDDGDDDDEAGYRLNPGPTTSFRWETKETLARLRSRSPRTSPKGQARKKMPPAPDPYELVGASQNQKREKPVMMAHVHHQSFYASELLKCGCSFMYRHNEILSHSYCIDFLHMRYVPVCVVTLHPLATSSTLVFWPRIWKTLPIPMLNGLPGSHFFEDEEGRKIFPWPKSFAEIVGFPKKLWFTTCSQGWLTGKGLDLIPKEVRLSKVVFSAKDTVIEQSDILF